MRCILLLFTFVALCYSYRDDSLCRRNINIKDDGTIIMTDTNGKRITITKVHGITGKNIIEVTVSGPNVFTKKIEIHDQDVLKDSTMGLRQFTDEVDVLTEILNQHQGVVDEKTFEKLLKEINTAVQSGELNGSVYDILRSLCQIQGQMGQNQEFWTQQQDIFGRRFIDQQRQNVLDQNTMQRQDILDLLQRKVNDQKLQQLEQMEQLQQQQQQQQGIRGGIFDVINPRMYERTTTQFLSPYDTTFSNQYDENEGRMMGNRVEENMFEMPTRMEQQVPFMKHVVTRPKEDDVLFGVGRTRTFDRGFQQITPFDQQNMQVGLKEVIQEEREILENQRLLQLQQEKQQMQQQQLQHQLQWQQQQQQQLQQQQQQQQFQQQQLQQQMQQQMHQQRMQQQQMQQQLKEQLREQLQQQQQDYPMHNVQVKEQQSRFWPFGRLFGGHKVQDMPMTQRFNTMDVPMVM